jgi:hypothetical protein
LTGNVLESVITTQIPLPGTAHTPFTPLVIQFSQALQSLTLSYAYLDINHDTVSVQAMFSNGQKDGAAVTVTGTVPYGFANPEGSLTLAPTSNFNSIVVSTTSVALAVDNIAVTLPNQTKPPPIATDEPTSLLLMGIGALGMMVFGWRQSRVSAES